MENPAARRREEDDAADDDGAGSDRISQLPESVLHHILCFLSQKTAGQTSVLSKSWRHLGPTRPVIKLLGCCHCTHERGFNGHCENCFEGINNEEFLSLVDSTFQRYHHHNLSPQEIHLQMLCVDSESISVIEKWIPIFINPDKPGVTTFRLLFSGGPHFNLLSVIFKAESLRELCLEWCRFDIPMDDVMLRNLQHLSLHAVEISDEALEKVLAGCSLVKCLVLRNCVGFKTININGNKNPYLNRFQFSSYYPAGNEVSVETEVPNIHYFEYIASDVTFLSTTLSAKTTSREWKSHLNLYHCVYASNVLRRILKLYEMVKALSQSQITLTLFETFYFKINRIEWDFDDRPVVVQHLGLRIGKFCPDSFTHFLNALFRIFRPRYTTAVSDIWNNNEKVSKFLWETLIHEREEMECGWGKLLEEVSNEASDKKGKVWHHVESTCWPEWSYYQKRMVILSKDSVSIEMERSASLVSSILIRI